MKKQNKNIISSLLEMKISRKFFSGVIYFILFGFAIAFAADIVTIIAYQDSTGFGSSSSVISTSRGTNTYYVNKGDNSTAIGNYFEGYYYDSILGYYQLDWSADPDDNVRIVDSTEACGTGYGYKLGGFAYNTYYGFMEFDYSDSIYVYYCLNDGQLHGYAYNRYVGFQNFDGISLDVFPTVSTAFLNPSSDIFVNDVTDITTLDAYTGSTSNKDDSSIGGERYNLDDTQEATFYIIK